MPRAAFQPCCPVSLKLSPVTELGFKLDIKVFSPEHSGFLVLLTGHTLLQRAEPKALEC